MESSVPYIQHKKEAEYYLEVCQRLFLNDEKHDFHGRTLVINDKEDYYRNLAKLLKEFVVVKLKDYHEEVEYGNEEEVADRNK